MKNLILKLSIALVAIVGAFFINGCYPDSSLSYDQTDIVLTGYYDSVNFKAFKTYYLPDTVFPVRDDTTNKEPVEYSDLILQEIEKNMQSYGYTRMYFTDTSTVTPDLMMAVAAISTTTVTVGWWYPYYPGWGWGWGWGWYKSSERNTDYWYYPGYPGYYPPGWGWGGVPYYSSYTTGTLLMEMSNPDDFRVVDGDTVTPMYWAGAVNGVLGGSSVSSRISNGIDQAYEQSPYLKTN